eukprot:TRINITY_DN41847_c0_g1_i1.p1 TRINITY_DN41847_c0_g1~~TRINITY_DN41847_c0_g1_i1.p1  ORF type:complete len:118 (+),score=8.72 TRINITY_DN41847_c0_g1_i1:76-429(+)
MVASCFAFFATTSTCVSVKPLAAAGGTMIKGAGIAHAAPMVHPTFGHAAASTSLWSVQGGGFAGGPGGTWGGSGTVTSPGISIGANTTVTGSISVAGGSGMGIHATGGSIGITHHFG